MWMELQGKKATHDFLSLYNKDSSPPPSQGAYLKTHDFLRPLERAEKAAAGGIDINRTAVGPAEHVLPGGIGTYSIGHVVGLGMRAAAIKPEQATCAAVPGAAAPDQRQQRKREPDPDDGAVGFTLWEEPAAKHAAESRGRWPPATFAAPGSGAAFGSLSSSRQQGLQERKRLMESVSRSSDDDDEFVKRDGSVHLKGELTVKVDRRSSDPSTPRSKHSATEQRRRSKINDRFQILRELIPHSDQKRDKASFLLEVIEYIRFLQEKVQKYEMSYPGWNQENAWEKVYFRSIWKNARNHSQGPVDGAAEPSQVIRNGPAATGFKFSGRFDDSNIPAAPAMVSNSQNPSESDNTTADISYKMIENSPAAALRVPLQPNFYATIANGTAAAQTQQMLASDRDNFESQSHSQVDCTVSSDMVNEQEELTVDDGTISVSSIYSQGLLTSLTRALQTSGVDLSQASISVQINLGKRVNNTRATIFSTKEHEDPSSGDIALGQPRVSNCCDELKHLPKRMRTGNK